MDPIAGDGAPRGETGIREKLRSQARAQTLALLLQRYSPISGINPCGSADF